MNSDNGNTLEHDNNDAETSNPDPQPVVSQTPEKQLAELKKAYKRMSKGELIHQLLEAKALSSTALQCYYSALRLMQPGQIQELRSQLFGEVHAEEA